MHLCVAAEPLSRDDRSTITIGRTGATADTAETCRKTTMTSLMRISSLSALALAVSCSLLWGCNNNRSQLPPVGATQQDAPALSSSTTDADRRDAFPGRNGRIAFLYGLPSINGGDVYTMNSDGSHVVRVTHFGPSFATAVGWENWSPDGRLIVFEKWRASDGRTEVWLMNADGTGRHPLRHDPKFFDRAPSFSPRGDWVVFARCFPPGGDLCSIYRAKIDGTGLTAITHFSDNAADIMPVYSPDGTKIAFNSYRRGGFLFALSRMNADGSGVKFITPQELGAKAADWSPDGLRLVFSTGIAFFNGLNGRNEEIWTSDPQGGDLQRLTQENFPGQRSYYAEAHDIEPAWSPRGDAIVFQRWNAAYTKSSISVLTHQGAAWTSKLILSTDSLGAPKVQRRSRYQLSGNIRDFALGMPGGEIPRWGSAPNIH